MEKMPGGAAGFGELFGRKALTHGRVLVNQVAILVKVAQMHDLENVAVEKSAGTLMDTLAQFFEFQQSFSLYLIGDYFYLEDTRIKFNVEDFANFEFLAAEFRKRQLGALSFNSSISPPELIAFASAFLGVDQAAKDVYQALATRIAGAGVSGLSTEELKTVVENLDFETSADTAAAARKAYIRLVLRVRELMEGISAGSPADTRKLKRAVQSLVDSVYKNEAALLRLSAIRRSEDVAPRHYANVCVLSLGMGKRLGLSKFQMARLGMAAALHDIGRHNIPPEVIERALDLDVEAMARLRGHTRAGVEMLLRLKGLNESAVSAMIVAYEHHRNLDGTGYPEQVEPKQMSLFSRIVRVADNYDAMTSSGIYGRLPMQPDRTLAMMLNRSGGYFDDEPLGAFSAMMGVYPAGTLVALSDGSTGVVSGPCAGGGCPSRPEVTLIQGVEGGPGPGACVRLDEKDGQGRYVRSVAGSLDPHQVRINIYKYLA